MPKTRENGKSRRRTDSNQARPSVVRHSLIVTAMVSILLSELAASWQANGALHKTPGSMTRPSSEMQDELLTAERDAPAIASFPVRAMSIDHPSSNVAVSNTFKGSSANGQPSKATTDVIENQEKHTSFNEAPQNNSTNMEREKFGQEIASVQHNRKEDDILRVNDHPLSERQLSREGTPISGVSTRDGESLSTKNGTKPAREQGVPQAGTSIPEVARPTESGAEAIFSEVHNIPAPWERRNESVRSSVVNDTSPTVHLLDDGESSTGKVSHAPNDLRNAGNGSTSNDDSASLEFRGVPMDSILAADQLRQVQNVDNITQISFMMYRLIKTHGIKSFVDAPCVRSKLWMPSLLHFLDLEIPGFKYYCVVRTKKELADVKPSFGLQGSPEYIVQKDIQGGNIPTADLAFLWNMFGFVSPKESWVLLKKLKTSKFKYVLLPNYPELRTNPSAGTHHGRVNVRRPPYRFTEALRVLHNVSRVSTVTKQMLFYDIENLRHDDP